MEGRATEKAILKMKRLLSLVRRGEGGEAGNAERKLNDLLRKYGLGLSDIEDEAEEAYRFNFKSDQEWQLFIQVYAKMRGADNLAMSNSKRRVDVVMTRAEHALMKGLWPIYLDEWKKEVELVMSAFIQKNHLYPADGTTITDPGPEELERIREMFKRAENIRRVNPERMIT